MLIYMHIYYAYYVWVLCGYKNNNTTHSTASHTGVCVCACVCMVSVQASVCVYRKEGMLLVENIGLPNQPDRNRKELF